jgi:pimeloyl-ACP methyl ester carboxylesterase
VTTLHVRPAVGATRAVALVLPGGRADSFEPTTARHLSGVRMRPFAASLQRDGSRHGLAVWSLRYQVRGWNGELASPLADVTSMLEEVRRRHADVPVVLVGHSMGGRVAMRLAGDASVVAAVGLAPWLPDGEPVEQLSGRRVLLVHGDRDGVTSPGATKRFAERASAIASHLDLVIVRGERHAMVLRSRVWHRLTTAFTLDCVGIRAVPPRVQDLLARGYV